MIPKILHYCWYGGKEKDAISRACIKTYGKAFNADRIIEWNEQNSDLHSNKFVEDANEQQKWAFVSDYVRLKALYEYGGVYFDTDVEIRKPFEESWFEKELVMGYLFDNMLSTAIIMVRPRHPLIKRLLDEYDNGTVSASEPNNILMTRIFKEYYPSFQITGENSLIDNNESEIVLDRHYFEHPTFDRKKGYSIHHCHNSWHVHQTAWKQKLRPVHKWLQFHCFIYEWWYKNYVQ